MSRYRSSGGLDDPRVEDGDVGFVGINQRQPPWQLKEGFLRLSENGRIDGEWVPRKGCKVVSTQSLGTGSGLRLPFWLIDTTGGVTITAASRTGETVTVTVGAGHGLDAGATGAAWLKVTGLGFVGPESDPNGFRLATRTSATEFTFEMPGAVGNYTYTISGDERALSVIDDSASGVILASCLFSDPNDANREFVFLAFEDRATSVDLSDGSVTEYGLPVGESISDPCAMIQAMDRVFIFRGGKVALEWASGDTDFALVANGVYGQPQVLTTTNVEVVDGLVDFTVSGNTTIAAGDWLTVYVTSDSRFDSVVGQSFQVQDASSTSIKAYMPLPDMSSGASTSQIGRPVTGGVGFMHQPGFPWAVYFQRRLWGPWQYRWDTSLTPDGFTDRAIRDEIVASDILDPDTFDQIENQFRITGGTADRVMALHPFYDDLLLVLNRNSIHGIYGTLGDLADSQVKELTREVGCLARKSVVSQGNRVFFLSDNGVYGLEFADQYNLRGVERPISEAIQPYIDRISWSLAGDAVAAFHNNRYWLAVPLDSTPKQGDATGNNAILVFNTLNGAWESVDTFGDPSFLVLDLIVGAAEERNDLYAVTSNGGIHQLNALDEDYDQILTNISSANQQFPISARMQTRGFVCGTLDRKRFAEFSVQMAAGSGQSDIQIDFATDDPDSVGSSVMASATMGEILGSYDSADVRARCGGLRGFNGQLTISRIAGRPEIRSTKVSATVTNRAVITQS